MAVTVAVALVAAVAVVVALVVALAHRIKVMRAVLKNSPQLLAHL